jgi:hypothetical protein
MSFLPDTYGKEEKTVEARLAELESLVSRLMVAVKPLYFDWKRRCPEELETPNTPEAIKKELKDIPF